MFLAYVRAVWNRGSQLALFFHPAVLHSYSARLPHGQSPLIMTCAARLFQCCLQLVKIPPPPFWMHVCWQVSIMTPFICAWA